MAHITIFFDLDGVVFDSYDLWDQVVSQLLAVYGVSYTETIKQNLWQLSMKEANDYLLSLISTEVDELAFEQAKSELLLASYRQVPLMTDVAFVLKEMVARGFCLYAVTSNDLQLAKTGLESHGLLTYFSKVISSLGYGDGEKDTDFFQHLLEEEGLMGADVCMVEDSLENLKNAASVGIKGIYMKNELYPMLGEFSYLKTICHLKDVLDLVEEEKG